MELRISRVLLGINALSLILLLLLWVFANPWPGVLLGVPFLLFSPGFTLLAALSPKRGPMGNTERLILSFVLSIAVTAFLGLGLNYTGFGITAISVAVTVSLFIYLASVIAWIRISFLPYEDRAVLDFRVNIKTRGAGPMDTILTGIMIVIVVATLTSTIYYAAASKETERFTQFYLSEANGTGSYYPDEMSIGDTGEVKLSIANHEGALVSYRVRVYVEDTMTDEIGPLVLGDGEEWQGLARFSPRQPGEDQEVEFRLFRDGNSRPYLESLYIWVDVPVTGMIAGE